MQGHLQIISTFRNKIILHHWSVHLDKFFTKRSINPCRKSISLENNFNFNLVKSIVRKTRKRRSGILSLSFTCGFYKINWSGEIMKLIDFGKLFSVLKRDQESSHAKLQQFKVSKIFHRRGLCQLCSSAARSTYLCFSFAVKFSSFATRAHLQEMLIK